MADELNIEPEIEGTKTSSGDGSNNKTTGDSEVQQGHDVVEHAPKMPYDKAEDQQEFINPANNSSKNQDT